MRVALLDVLAGLSWVHLAAIRTAEVLQMSAEGLQCGMDTSFCTQGSLVLIGKGFIFVKLWRWRRISGHIVLDEFLSFWHTAVPIIIVRGSKEVCCGGRPWGAWRARRSRFTLWTLTKKSNCSIYLATKIFVFQ